MPAFRSQGQRGELVTDGVPRSEGVFDWPQGNGKASEKTQGRIAQAVPWMIGDRLSSNDADRVTKCPSQGAGQNSSLDFQLTAMSDEYEGNG
ncbi:hypothetical protein D9M70_375090 [compost metagenome]